MKKLLFLAIPLAIFSGMASAAAPPSCTATNGNQWTVAELGTTGCEIGDKIFSNFTASLDNASDFFTFIELTPTEYEVQLSPSGGVGNTDFGSTMTWGYTISVDETQVTGGKTAAITSLSASISDGANGSSSSLGKVGTPASGSICTVNYTEATAAQTSSGGNVCNYNTTSLSVADTYTYTGGGNPSGVTAIDNVINQTLTVTSSSPEPMSMLLFGSGLLACGFIGRKRFARK